MPATLGIMRGGVARWKRGVGGTGVASAVAYAFDGACDSTHSHTAEETAATINAARYAGMVVERHTVTDSGIAVDALGPDALRVWFAGSDPETGERRGRDLTSPATDLVFDATINAPKSYSLAAVLDPELEAAYEALQDRLRDRTIRMWQRELNARRGAGGLQREDLAQIEVVELRHERSRALDAHKHRHLWLNAKVLGRDGRWSSLDSRVMLRLQNVVNAEGDLAARTDPEWLAALAAKGYTLDADGEIAELATVVRPLSRRAQQIEANKAVKLAEWHQQHPGQTPDRDVLAAIDRWAWAHQRPDKPDTLDEDEWRDTVRREIADIDPALVTGVDRSPVPVMTRQIADIDRDDLALRAVADADGRASGSGGRFSDFDLRAGVIRAVAAAGVIADRSVFEELIEDVTARAVTMSTVSMLTEANVPGHVKHRMATRTVGAKLSLADKFDRLTAAGVAIDVETVTAVAAETLPEGRTLDHGQTDAAAAIAGTDRLVTVTGPAGTGKTTMLQVARRLLENQGRRMVIVAPTKKAASVAGIETGADAASLHALLHDYGFRWRDTPTGQQWTRLVPGQDDPDTGRVWEGPQRFTLTAGDRIVVDEAGMVDLHTANALADVAADTGADLALVGDHLQALPVGHSGAMSLARSRSTAAVELSAVHRFRTADGQPDTAWADLTLRVREPGRDIDQVAAEVLATGHAVTVATEQDARQHMVDEWLTGHGAGKRVALVTATHDEAQQISEAIQLRRVEAGQLDTGQQVMLQRDQVAYVGDVVQTRRNDRTADVENRQVWTITAVDDTSGAVTLASLEDPGMTRQVDAAYAAEHAHLAYASTVHGVQGETTDRSLVGPGVDAAGLYVGLTRGRTHNAAIVIADSDRGAREQLVEAMQRGRIEATIDDSRAAARQDLSRAARWPHTPVDENGQTAPWHDRTARPMGHLIKIEEILANAVDQEKALYDQVTRLGEVIATDQAALDEINVKISTWDARHHGQAVDGEPAPLLLPVKDQLTRRLAAAREERSELSREYRKITRRIDLAQKEIAVRGTLGDDIGRYEQDARRRALRERRASTTPAWDDRTARPFGRVIALRSLQESIDKKLAEIAAERDERAGRIATAREMIRTGAGPNGVEITLEQRMRLSESVDKAAAAYDGLVDKHANLVQRRTGVDRELTLRDELTATDPARAEAEERDRKQSYEENATARSASTSRRNGVSLS